MKKADRIRMHGRERYVIPARAQKAGRFSIRAGDVVRELRMMGQTPAVCSALKTRKFLQENNLRLVGRSGPDSGQSTTVTYTYEFIDGDENAPAVDPWEALRGIGKEVFAALGGGEAFLRRERAEFNEAMEKRERQSRP